MHVLSFAEGALAMLGLVAVLLAYIAEAMLFDRRIRSRPFPWLERIQVLLFGILHLRGTR
ncbi:hypothetical protein [Metapseudomonas boanensis]|uniref:Uncharacterized protein n=1 Tax=Metapseudomonas boanensis TaxID=2822138 RepID=A0ABS5XGM3_9GAMM|nr:hypothetical protein [Pseudomonas boanensis]MBT8766839.1 hypothetical protein [Pseudomonas boanensis]